LVDGGWVRHGLHDVAEFCCFRGIDFTDLVEEYRYVCVTRRLLSPASSTALFLAWYHRHHSLLCTPQLATTSGIVLRSHCSFREKKFCVVSSSSWSSFPSFVFYRLYVDHHSAPGFAAAHNVNTSPAQPLIVELRTHD